MLRLALPATRATSLVIFPFTQGIVERKYNHVPWTLAERIRGRMRVHPYVAVAAAGQTARAIFEAGGDADSARGLLGARWMLSGAVEPIRTDTRVRVRLIESSAAVPAWQEEFLLSQHSIAEIEQLVSDSVSQRLTRRAAPPDSRGRLENAELDHSLAAAQYLLTEHTLASTETARKELEALFQKDTAPAIATSLARATVLMLERGGLTPPERPAAALRRVDALVEYILAREPRNAEAWTVRAMAARYRDPIQFRGAEAAHKEATSRDPRSADAAYQYAVTLMQLGGTNEARTQLRRALTLDPGHPGALARLSELERQNRRPELSCALANAAIAADPFDPRVYGSRALARLRVSQAREAFADAETAMQLTDAIWAKGIRLMVEVQSANVSLAQSLGRQYAQQLVASRAELAVEDALSLARAFAALGFDREAEGALIKARPAGIVLRRGLAEPVFESVRSRPAIAALVRSIPPRR